jgi:hypothetical protein
MKSFDADATIRSSTTEWLTLMGKMQVTQLRVQERVMLNQPQHQTDATIGPRINGAAKAKCRLMQQ